MSSIRQARAKSGPAHAGGDLRDEVSEALIVERFDVLNLTTLSPLA